MSNRLLPATQKWMRQYNKQAKWVNDFYGKLTQRKIRLNNIKPEEIDKLREVMANQVALVPADHYERQVFIDATAHAKRPPADMCFVTMPDAVYVYRLWRASLQENLDWVLVNDPATGELMVVMPAVFEDYPPEYERWQAIVFDQRGKATGWMNMADFTRSVEEQLHQDALEENTLRDELKRQGGDLTAVGELVANSGDRRNVLNAVRADVQRSTALAKEQGLDLELFREVFGNRLDMIELALWNAADAVDVAARQQGETNSYLARLIHSIEAGGFSGVLPTKEDEAQAELYFSRPYKSPGGAGATNQRKEATAR